MTTPHLRRRFFRYSLRTLFVVVTVFCVWMGMIAKAARDQRLAVEAIQEAGGTVYYQHQVSVDRVSPSLSYSVLQPSWPGFDPPGPAWLRKLIGDEYFFSVWNIILNGPKINDRDVAAVKRLTKLEILSLKSTNVTDAGLVHLTELTNLQFLCLFKSQFTDAGLEHLKRLTNLQTLDLGSTRVSDTGLENLKGLTNLRELKLENTKITDAGLESVKRLANLQVLHLNETQVTAEGVAKLQQALPNCKITR